MNNFVRNQNGFIVFVSLIMVMISLGFTVGYLHNVMGSRIIFMQRYAEARARYNAFSGISEQISPLLKSEYFNQAADTTLDDREIEEMYGGYRDVYGTMKENLETQRSQRFGRATGYSTYNSFANEPIEVVDTLQISYRGRGFEEFMYLTNEESPSGPWPGTTVNFGSGEVLEGLVYSNDDITMSNFGCPTFVNYEIDGEVAELSQVYTAGNFHMGACTESIFEGVFEDSMPRIEWPPYEGQDLIRSKADYIYNANDYIALSNTDPTWKDQLVMTRIEFQPGQFTVKQWLYHFPPHLPIDENSTVDEVNQWNEHMLMYYPKRWRDMNLQGSNVWNIDAEMQHFDFSPPGNIQDYVRFETVVDDKAVIWIEGGQVQVKGTIGGRYTIATSGPQLYKMYHDNMTLQELNCNIWIIDDLLYEDSNVSTGYVPTGSINRLGLLSGGNIIVANTGPNGSRNSTFGTDVKINAAMIAMNEAFIVHYWQNSTAGYNFLDGMAVKGDNRGVRGASTGQSDIRGTVVIHGSVVQDKRGYLKRNFPAPGTGGYPITPGIGYDKDYHYDRNLRDFPPPEWPETKNADGSQSLVLSGIGEYTGE